MDMELHFNFENSVYERKGADSHISRFNRPKVLNAPQSGDL